MAIPCCASVLITFLNQIKVPKIGSRVSPGPTSPLGGQQPSVTEAVAKDTGGSGKDMAKPVLLGRASPTILPHEAQTESSSSSCDDGDEPSASWFIAFFMGESGLGKSTLVNSLFLTDMYRDRKLLNAEERITQTVEITKHVVDIEEKGVKLRLTIVDTPGFGDAVNNTECWKPVADYIDQQFEQYFRDESGLNRKNIQDNRVHCCIYFISPFGHGLRPLDVEFMRALHQRVNIVPVLAKADTLTPIEVERMKNKIREEIDHYGIRIYQFPECDSDEDEEFKLQDQALKESIPFAVIGSNTVVEAKGRRVRGRLYPWGIVEVENPSHCDFVKLRTMLVRTHMQDLKDVTRETHYENYRTQCIQSMTRMVVKERNRNKLTRESGTDFPIPVIPPVPDAETEKLIREKDEEIQRWHSREGPPFLHHPRGCCSSGQDMDEVRLSRVSSQDYRCLAEALRVGCAWGNSTIYLRHWFMSAFVEKTMWPPRSDARDPSAGLEIHPQATSLV
ncbi:PREDICTED: septin-4 [Charadrius vociferus]|uniref:septin-4 n=1 Tax=Charadrius vociferus TaxID=50402 RepID=UPI00052150EA|nr:PREDICTED: septin-4 [Charadrius vociferus]